MAQRFGGKHSPDGTGPAPGKRPMAPPRRAAARRNFLFIAPLPLLISAFAQGALGMATDLAALAILLLAAWLLSEGLRAEAAWAARKVARRPGIPRKMFASAFTGIGVALAAFSPENGVIAPAILGIIATALHVTAFGVDPMRDKGMEGVDAFQTDRVARAVDEAEKHLAAMKDAILRAKDRGLERRVDAFQATARDMFAALQDDPRDLTSARKYLSVYLLGARDATAKFADIYARNRDPQARADYEALLDDLETSFAARTEKLMLSDRSDLDVEIEVLRERLEREGIRTE